jgi:hypothetical protein
MKHWLITDKGDQDCRKLADNHYSRQTPGSFLFTRNGQNLVFTDEANSAVWVTFRPTPGKAVRKDKLNAWECALFRNTGNILSSILIREACELTVALWGHFPPDGLITFILQWAVKSPNKGCCYKKAGWIKNGYSSDGKLRLVAPSSFGPIPNWKDWKWKGDN